ncbi:MAG TPA: DedA family protein [Candidatus Bathyarchaeia archaeon]|nr:DedA family protein [Candidatus Bathyarchaeia archaeon]
MQVDFFLDLIQQYGYLALFFALWLGIVGMPIPDEVIVMTGGMVASFQILRPIPAFLVTYLGVVSGLSLGYVLGRVVGVSVLDRLAKKAKMQLYIAKSQDLLQRYGNQALIISYFLPVVRHVVPYLVGISNMSFRRYALYSYTTGFIWTLGFFIAGHLLGENAPLFGQLIANYSQYGLFLIPILLLIVYLIRYQRKSSKLRKNVHESH